MLAYTTILFFFVTFAFTANAAIIGKRATSAPVNDCVALVNGVQAEFFTLKKSPVEVAITPPNPATSKTQGVPVGGQKIINSLGDIRDTCCRIPVEAIKGKDVGALFGALQNYESVAYGALNLLQAEKFAFDKGQSNAGIQQSFNDLLQSKNSFRECLTLKAQEVTI